MTFAYPESHAGAVVDDVSVTDGAPPALERHDRSIQPSTGATCGAEVRPREADRLLLHVAARLRSSGGDLSEARLLQLAEEVIADVAHVVLAWAEEPLLGAVHRPST